VGCDISVDCGEAQGAEGNASWQLALRCHSVPASLGHYASLSFIERGIILL
jgi:hypothetical protein